MEILKIYREEHLEIKYNMIKIQNMMDIKEVLLQWLINFLIRSQQVVLLKMKLSQKKLAEELHKTIIRKFEKRKVHSSFKDNIWGADLADMQLISKFNKGICFLLCVVDIYCKHA